MRTIRYSLPVFLSIIATVLLSGQVCAQVNLVGYWRFDEGTGTLASDSSGGGQVGTVVGPLWVQDTHDGMGFALEFDGTDDYVDLGGFDVVGEALTIALWFKADGFGVGSQDGRLISKAVGTLAEDHYWMVSTIKSDTGPRLRFRLRTNGATTTLIASSGELSTDTWTHVAAVYDGLAMWMFKDGVEVGSTSKSGLLDVNSSVLAVIGNHHPDAGSRPFFGVIDDVRVYDNALTLVDIQTLANRRPVAGDDNYSANRNATLVVNAANGVLSNDWDDEGDPLSATLWTYPANGTAVLNSDGSFSYAPTIGFTGVDSVTYKASDGEALSDRATVTLSVIDPNAPLAEDDTYSVAQNSILVADAYNGVLANDSDPQMDPIIAVLVADAGNGHLTLTDDGSFVYIPTIGFSGDDAFAYLASDGLSDSPVATVAISVTAPEVVFDHVVIDVDNPLNPHCKAVGDISGDGYIDVVVASSSNGGMYWYEWPGWRKHPIRLAGSWTTDLQVSDVDNDGDYDVIAPGVDWYENPLPNGDPATDTWTAHFIGASESHDLEVGDIDGDGRLDVVVRQKNNGFTNVFFQDGPTSWVKRTINTRDGEGTAIGDIDHDLDLDVVHNGFWLENPGPGLPSRQSQWIEHVIDDTWAPDVSAHVTDVNGDGSNDVVLAPSESSGRFSWYESDQPRGNVWTEHLIDPTVQFFHTFKSGDVDLDGDTDFVTAEMHQSTDPDEVSIYYNDGNGLTWRKQIVAITGSHNLRVADIGNDGDLDIVGANWNDAAPNSAIVELWQNTLSNSLDSWRRHVVDSQRPWRSVFIEGADIDGDFRTDIVTGAWWYRNPGTPSGPWSRHTIGTPLNNMSVLADFDGNGTVDILGTQGVGASSDARFVWAQNDGLGGFLIHQNIPEADGDFLQGVVVGQLDPLVTAPLEVALSWHASGRGVQMFTVPESPLTQEWSWQQISTVSQDEQLSAGDIDRDGDVDLLLGTQWLRNDGTTWTAFALSQTSAAPDRNRLADVNGDGRLDAIVGFEAISIPGDLVWYEQPVDATSLWTEHHIATLIGPMSLDVADMDRDGSLDVVVGEHNLADPSAAGLFVFANSAGKGLVWEQHTVYVGDEHHDGAIVVDIDDDGDNDILSIGWGHSRVLLYENKALDLCLLADLDCDDDVDLSDYAVFEGCLAGPGQLSDGCLTADIDRDGDADMADFALVQSGFTDEHTARTIH